MKNIVTFAIEAKKYLFAVLLLIGTSVCAWGASISSSPADRAIDVYGNEADGEITFSISSTGIIQTYFNSYQAYLGAYLTDYGDNDTYDFDCDFDTYSAGTQYIANSPSPSIKVTYTIMEQGTYETMLIVYGYDSNYDYYSVGIPVTITVSTSVDPTYTVNFNAGSGNTLVAGTSGISGDGQQTGNITTASMSVLPTATPCTNAVTAGWTFDGWHEGTVSAGSTSYSNKITTPYVPTSATTLNAVYTMKGSTMTSVTLTQQTGTMPAAGQYIALTQMSNPETAISNTTVTNHQSLKKVPGGNNCSYSNNKLTSTNSNVVYELVDAGTSSGNQYYYLKNVVSGKYLASTINDKELEFITPGTSDKAKWRFIPASSVFYVMNKSRTGYLYWDSSNSYWECRDKDTQPTQGQWQVQVYSASPSSFTIPTYYQSALDCSVKYHVTYAAGCDMAEITSGSVPVDDTDYDNGDWVTAAANTLVRPGYTFNGWLNSVSGYLVYPGGDPDGFYISANVTLTAQWTAAPSTLTIASPGNVTIEATSPAIAEGGSASVTTGTTVTLSYSSIAGGYAWAGWNVYKTGDPTTTVSVSGSNQFTMPNYDVTVDATLYQKSKLQTRCQAEVDIEIEGSVYLTSYAGVPVYTTDNPDNRITVTCADFGTADRLTITYMKNGEAVAKGNSLFRLCGTDYNVVDGTNDYISVSGTAYASGQKFVIRYTPEAGVYDRTDTYTLRLTAQNGSTPLGYQDIVLNGRALPEKFVIAAQINGQWCALPADLATSSGKAIQDAYPITVNNDVTAAIAAPKTAIYSAAARNNPTKHRGGVRLNTVTGSNDGHLQAPRSNDLTYLWRTSNNCSTGMQEWYLTSSDLQIYNIGVDPNIYVSSGSGGDDDTEGSTSTLLNRYLCVYGNQIMWTSSVTPAHREFRILPVTNEYEPVEMQVVEWKADGIKFMYFGNPAYTAEVEIEGVNKASAAALGSALRVDVGVYEIAVSDLMNSAYKQMNIIIKNGGTEVGRKQVNVPLIVNTETTIESARSTAGITVKANCSNVDLVVLNEGKLSSSETTDASQFTFKSITVYGGGKLIVPAGNYLTAKKMYLRAGSVNATTKGATPATSYSYVYPQVYIGSGSTLTINENIINFDYLTNYDQYFGVAFPHAAAINKNNITYPDDIYGSAAKTGSYLLRVFDSQIRATQGAVDNVWVDVETGSEAMPKQTNTIRGLGYYALFPPRKVSVNGGDAERQKYGIQRVKMSAESLSNENANASIEVKAYSAEQPYNAGWWMLGNPYMANLNGDGGVGDTEASILVGKIGKNAQGQYEWQDKEVRYVTVPNDDASETYDQRPVSNYTFPAFKPFYVQVGENGTVTFTTTSRVNAAPSRFFNNEMPAEIETAIALNSEAYGDTTHILINNEFTSEYEVGDDLLKMPHANVSLFTISGTTDLFANALNAQLAAEGIPVGYTAPTEGQYTFSYNDKLSTAWLEHLWLIDYVQNSTIDLLESDYTFNATAETNKTRFVLKIELKSGKEDPTTSIDGLIETSPNDGPIKFIYQDKLYIRYNGIIYDAVGKKVK